MPYIGFTFTNGVMVELVGDQIEVFDEWNTVEIPICDLAGLSKWASEALAEKKKMKHAKIPDNGNNGHTHSRKGR